MEPGDTGGEQDNGWSGASDQAKLLTFSDLNRKGIPFSRQHVARLIKLGRFPAPIKLGVGTNRWIASEIDDWLDQRKADRDATLAARLGNS